MIERNGPEFVPIRNYVKDFPIVVTIYDQNDNVVRSERMNYGDKDDRLWLGKISYWSWSQGYAVETEKDGE